MGSLDVRQIVKRFRDRTVVDRVSFRVQSGEVVGLLGRNGAGKTTSFRIAIGMIPADAGLVVLNEQDVTELPMYQRAQLGMGYLAQEPAVFGRLTVEENVTAILELRGMKRSQIKERVDRLLTEFGLQVIRGSKAMPGRISGGERRRLEIVRALACDPSIILMDEPLAGVDPIAVGEVVKLIRGLAARNIGILITEHNVASVLPILDRAYIIHEGKAIFSGTPEEVVANEAVREFYLGREFQLPAIARRQ